MTTLSKPHLRRATMNDVARLAGVSLKTVSRVVNDEPGVHSATAARVHLAIERLGYRRNVGARNLRSGLSTGMIGVITEDIGNPFYSLLVRAVEAEARQHDRHVLSASSEEDARLEQDLVLEFCARQVEGLVIVPAGAWHGYLAPELHAGIKVVFADRPPGDIAVDTVLADNLGGMIAAVRHLAHHGHHRIAFFGDTPGIFTAEERLRGFQEGCVSAGLRCVDELVVMGPHDQRSIGAALDRVLHQPDPATALISGNNRIAVLTLRALAGRPDRPALLGFDDFELADLLDPPISVIAQDAAALGRSAAELLFARLAGDEGPPRRVIVPVRVIARGSGEIPPRSSA